MSIKRAYRLNDDATQAIKEIQRRLGVTSAGIAAPDHPLSFDPESEAMQPGKIADAAGLPRDLAYAIRKPGYWLRIGTETYSTRLKPQHGTMLSPNIKY